MKKRTKKKLRKTLFTLILTLLLALFGYLYQDGSIQIPGLSPTNNLNTLPPIPVDGALSVHYIDVGQADAIFLSCGGDYMLIDAGDRGDGNEVVAYLQELGVTELDYLVGTHPHSDHMGDMDEVLKAFPVETFWAPELNNEALAKVFMQDTLDAAEAQNLQPTQPELGQPYALGDAQILVLGPVHYDYEDANDLSLVLLVQFGSTRFLFTGDMEKAAEHDMLEHWNNDEGFKADVLKVGHHGSVTSTGYRFLRAVDPDHAVIQVGSGNQYQHPNQETLDILGDAEVLTYRTDYLGTIVATSNGTDITFDWTNTGEKPYIPE